MTHTTFVCDLEVRAVAVTFTDVSNASENKHSVGGMSGSYLFLEI